MEEKVNCLYVCCQLGLTSTAKEIVSANNSYDSLREVFEKCLQSRIEKGKSVSLLHVAACGGHLETVQWLCDFAPQMLNVKSRSGDTPLMLALRNKHLNVARYLISQGANLYLRPDSEDGRAPSPFKGVKSARVIRFIVEQIKLLPSDEQKKIWRCASRHLGYLIGYSHSKDPCKAIAVLLENSNEIDMFTRVEMGPGESQGFLTHAIIAYEPVRREDKSAILKTVRMLVESVRLSDRSAFVNDQGCAPLLSALCFYWEYRHEGSIYKAVGLELVKYFIANGASVSAPLEPLHADESEDEGEERGLTMYCGRDVEYIAPGTTPIEYARKWKMDAEIIGVLETEMQKQEKEKKKTRKRKAEEPLKNPPPSFSLPHTKKGKKNGSESRVL